MPAGYRDVSIPASALVRNHRGISEGGVLPSRAPLNSECSRLLFLFFYYHWFTVICAEAADYKDSPDSHKNLSVGVLLPVRIRRSLMETWTVTLSTPANLWVAHSVTGCVGMKVSPVHLAAGRESSTPRLRKSPTGTSLSTTSFPSRQHSEGSRTP